MLALSGARVKQELNVIKLLKKIRLSLSIAKLQLDKDDIQKLQKEKPSVVDIDTSEPSDILSYKDDNSSLDAKSDDCSRSSLVNDHVKLKPHDDGSSDR